MPKYSEEFKEQVVLKMGKGQHHWNVALNRLMIDIKVGYRGLLDFE